MKISQVYGILTVVVLLAGCETAHEATKKGGEYIGKTTAVVGGVTEGATDGYVGKETQKDNPYGR